MRTIPLRAALVLAGLLSVGCASSRPAAMPGIYQAYQQGDYAGAYAQAKSTAARHSGEGRREAVYMAGMSAYQLGKLDEARRYLAEAAGSSDAKLAGDANAGLGMVLLKQGRPDAAEDAFLAATKSLGAQDKAMAHYYAAVAQQKAGKVDQARANFTIARSLTADTNLRQSIHEQLGSVGFTIQVGAFAKQSNAQTQAQRVGLRSDRVGTPQIVPAIDRDGRRLYLVQVGQFSTYDSALAGKSRLGGLASSAIIVPLR
ncbi:MAG: tetratricopeptide repeat protein [Phycisphaeraceae bacterium]